MSENHQVKLVRQGGAQVVQWVLDRIIEESAKELFLVFVQQVKQQLLEKYLGHDITFTVFLDEHCQVVDGPVIRAWLLHVRAISKGADDGLLSEVVGEIACQLNENDFVTQCYGGIDSDKIAAAKHEADALLHKLRSQVQAGTTSEQDFDWVLLGDDAMSFIAQLHLPPEVGEKLKCFFDTAKPEDYPEDVPVQIGVLKLKGQVVTNTETSEQSRVPMLEINMHFGRKLEDMHPEAKGELYHAQCFLTLDEDGNVMGYLDATPLH